MTATAVLIVDDHPANAALLRDVVVDSGYSAQIALDASEALHMMSQHAYDLVIVDLGIPALGGLELIRRLRERDSNVTILALGTFGMGPGVARAGGGTYLARPFEPTELRKRIEQLLKQRALYLAAEHLKRGIDEHFHGRKR